MKTDSIDRNPELAYLNCDRTPASGHGYSLDEPLVLEHLNRIAFQQLVGFRITCVTPERAFGELVSHPELGSGGYEILGEPKPTIVHGGAIATCLDTITGAVAGVSAYVALKNNARTNDGEIARRLSRMATLNLGVTFHRAARNDRFIADAALIRLGSRVCAVRGSFRTPDGTLLAECTSTFSF